MLRMADYDTQEYEKTRTALKNTGAKNRPETVERAKQAFLRAKRPLLVELIAVRLCGEARFLSRPREVCCQTLVGRDHEHGVVQAEDRSPPVRPRLSGSV